MCNAHNHSAGCSCGFGGRGYGSGSISLHSQTNWPQTAVKEPWLIRRGLEDLNWDEKGIRQFLAEYNELRNQELAPHTLAARLKQMLGWRTMEVEDQWTETLNVPLYHFSAPNARGAIVTYNENVRETRTSGWDIRVFGVGTGSTSELEVNLDFIFNARDGQCKVIAVPVPMRVERIVVRDNGKVVSTGIRAEVHSSKVDRPNLSNRVCKTVAAGHCSHQGEDQAEDTIIAPLSGIPRANIQNLTRSWVSRSEKDIWLALKKVVEVGPKIRVRRQRTLTLNFQLPGGYDYCGNLSRGRLWWEQPA